MRRFLLYFLALTGSLAISSCLTVEQDLTLNRDGSGVKSIKMDLSEMFSNPMMAMLSGEEGLPTELKDSSWVIIDELRADNPQWTAAEVAMLEQATGEMTMNAEDGIMLVTMETSFSSLTELKEIERLIGEANRPDEEGEVDGGPAGFSGIPDFSSFGQDGNATTNYELGKRSLKLMTPVGEAVGGLFDDMGMDGEAQMDMFKGLFEGATMIYTFNLPGKVKSVKGLEGAEIDGKMVTVSVDLLEVMEDPELNASILNGEIKFK